MTAILASGVKKSVSVTNVLNGVNLVVWVLILFISLFFISSDNWENGFLEQGWSGVSAAFSSFLIAY